MFLDTLLVHIDRDDVARRFVQFGLQQEDLLKADAHEAAGRHDELEDDHNKDWTVLNGLFAEIIDKESEMEQKITVLCYGDSNTYGYIPETGMRYPRDIRYPGRLQMIFMIIPTMKQILISSRTRKKT